MDPEGTGRRSALNESHVRRLRVTCQHVDGLLGDIEGILNEAGSGAAFPRYIPDIQPRQREAIEHCIPRIRAGLRRALESHGIPREQAAIPASRAIRFTLAAMDISLEELKPKYMRRYGEVSGETAADLNRIAADLQGVIRRLDDFLEQGSAGDHRNPGVTPGDA